MKHVDFAVVGGGILGLAAALTARSRGASVLLCEAGTKAMGASVRNFGQIVPSGQSTGLWRRLGVRSVEIYRELDQRLKLPMKSDGSLYVASDPEELQLLQEMHEFNASTGQESILLGPGATRARQPALDAGYVKGGLFYPHELTADSPALIEALTTALREDPGCDLLMGCRVREIDEGSGRCRLITAEGRVLEAAQVLVVPGIGLTGPLAEFLLGSDLRICRLQMMSVDKPPGLDLKGNLLTGLSIRRYAAFRSCPSRAKLAPGPEAVRFEAAGIHLLFTQRSDGTLIVGDSHAWSPAKDVDGLDYRIDMSVNALMLDEACRIFGAQSLRVRETWNGYYTEDPSGVYARTVTDRIHVVTGIGGKGMTTGPAVAEKVALQILDGRGVIDELFVEAGGY